MTTKLSRRCFLGLALAAPFLASACSGRRWFGRTTPDTLEPEEGYVRAAFDNRPLIREITAMSVEPTPGGVVVHATGLAASTGYWDVDLVPLPVNAAAPDTLRLEFRVIPPVTPEPGTIATRQVEAGHYVSNTRLDGIRTISVIGATNSRSSRR